MYVTVLCKNPVMNHNLPVRGSVQAQNEDMSALQ